MNDHGGNPSDEEIASCAYLIWEQEGKPEGQHHVHWSNAENKLMACHAHDEMNLSGQFSSEPIIASYSHLTGEQDGRIKNVHWTFAEERKLASKTIKPRRFFKLTADGQWNRKSADGKYNPLNAKRLLKKLQMKFLKHTKRTTTE